MPVEPQFRNVLCPWQTEREIKSQTKFIRQMLKRLRLSEEKEKELLGLDKPDRIWNSKGRDGTSHQ